MQFPSHAHRALHSSRHALSPPHSFLQASSHPPAEATFGLADGSKAPTKPAAISLIMPRRDTPVANVFDSSSNK